MSLPEVLLWQLLRRKLTGARFRHQHPIGVYSLDFYCPAAKLAFEIDGESHSMGDRPQRDTARDLWLRERGIEVIRLAAADVLKSPESAADSIARLTISRMRP